MKRDDAATDPEDVAFRARVKPALRLSLGPDDVKLAAERYRDLGAAAVEGRASATYDGETLGFLYVAWSEADARALQAAEAPSLGGEARADALREIGRLLGYPACCVEHFAVHTERYQRDEKRSVRERLSHVLGSRAARAPGPLTRTELLDVARSAQDYLAARDAYTWAPEPLLNHFCMAARASLISFYPCSYRCAAALAVARGTLEALERETPKAAAAIRAQLRSPIVLGACGGRARATIDRVDGRPEIVRDAEAPSAQRRPAFAADVSLAERAVEKRVDRHGWVLGVARPGEAPAILFDFGRTEAGA